mmetsp:Transcript_34187/g.108671  ORF Transcript_34187/g.108671 Transcript_34187/m.108671 type:complete len:92 (-) Transcript_34187:134-409(-)
MCRWWLSAWRPSAWGSQGHVLQSFLTAQVHSLSGPLCTITCNPRPGFQTTSFKPLAQILQWKPGCTSRGCAMAHGASHHTAVIARNAIITW